MGPVQAAVEAAVAANQTQVNVTLDQLVEQAKEEMGRGQRRRFERRCRLPGYYEMFVEEMRDKLLTEPQVMNDSMVAALAAPAFTSSTVFAIDIDRIREVLNLILEYAPKIIDLIVTLLGLF